MEKTLKLESSGKKIEIKIEKTKDVQMDIAYADGQGIPIGKKTVDRIHIQVYIDGKYKGDSYRAPYTIKDKDLISKGAYARVGDLYLGELAYAKVAALIAEMDTGIGTTEEYEQVKALEVAKEAAKAAAEKAEEEHYQRQINNGMCPKCGTWCYGDCKAN
jgi:hypothetical protein